MLRFDNRVAIITGAGRGVGRAHALLLAERGAAIVVNDLGAGIDGAGGSSAPADEVVEDIRRRGGRAVANHESIASPDGPGNLVRTALENFGRLDIVINNAGFENPTPFHACTLDYFRRHLEVHVLGAMGLTLAAWPHLIASGAGRVINTSSTALYGMPGRTGYGAAKGALLGFTRSLAVEGEAHGIKANCIAPMAGTRMADASGSPAAIVQYMREQMPTSLVAPGAAFLAHESCPLTGEMVAVGGGRIFRVALCESKGFAAQDLTPELIAANLDRVLDETSARVIDRVQFPEGVQT